MEGPQKSLNSMLYDAVADLAVKNEQLELARGRSAEARRNETAAMNRLNESQAAFDKLVAQVKVPAPQDSDWARWVEARK